MNLIFLRHGEAFDNVKKLISDKEIYCSLLTEEGKLSVNESIKKIPNKIDKIYVSPLPRTIQTANYVHRMFPEIEVIIEQRLRELYHGKYTHQKNNSDLDNTRLKQINGDYFIRLGEYGENNYDIESRLSEFLNDVVKNNFKDNTILIVSHGSVTSYMKRILNIKTPHIQTGKLEIFDNVNFAPLHERLKKLKNIKRNKINIRRAYVKNLTKNNYLNKYLEKIATYEFNNIDIDDNVLQKYSIGFKTNELFNINEKKFDDNVVLICIYNNFENFAEYWMQHYLKIGVKNFVLVDNKSTDNSTNILKKYMNIVNISFWEANLDYDCNVMCGIKQRIMEFYGNKTYLIVDSDELFIYDNYKKDTIDIFLKKHQFKYIKTLMMDVYSKKRLYAGSLSDYKYVDRNSYYVSSTNSFGNRNYGGPRYRLFKEGSNLQKIPLIKYSGKEVIINDHFYYPFDINMNAKQYGFLLHYELLLSDKIHLDNDVSFYDKANSCLIDEIDFNNFI